MTSGFGSKNGLVCCCVAIALDADAYKIPNKAGGERTLFSVDKLDVYGRPGLYGTGYLIYNELIGICDMLKCKNLFLGCLFIYLFMNLYVEILNPLTVKPLSRWEKILICSILFCMKIHLSKIRLDKFSFLNFYVQIKNILNEILIETLFFRCITIRQIFPEFFYSNCRY